MSRPLHLALAALTTITLCANEALAQGARSSLNQSQGGNLRGNAGGISSGRAMGSTGARGSALGGGQTRPGLGVNGMADANGASGQGGVGQGPMGQALANSAGERFQAGGFVGRDADDVRAGFESQSGRRSRGGMLDMMVENLNEMRDSRRRGRDQNSAPPAIRVQLRPAFDVPTGSTFQTAPQVQTRMTKSLAMMGVDSPQAELDGRTMIIRGVVATERDRELISRLASLEPGVSQVENLVEIQAPPSPSQR